MTTKAKSGFTLLEILVALTILVAIGLMTQMLPTRDGHALAVRSQSQLIFANLRMARQRAIATATPVRVAFASNNGRLASISVNGILEPISEIPTSRASVAAFEFRPDGTSSQSLTVELSNGVVSNRLSVVSATGLVRNEKL